MGKDCFRSSQGEIPFLDALVPKIRQYYDHLPPEKKGMMETIVGLATNRTDVQFLAALLGSRLSSLAFNYSIQGEVEGFFNSLGKSRTGDGLPDLLEKARERRLPNGTGQEEWKKQVDLAQSLAEATGQQTLLRLATSQGGLDKLNQGGLLEIAEEIAATAKRAVLQIALNRSATPEPGPDYYRLRLFALGARQIELRANNGQWELLLVFLSDQGETITKSYMIESPCGKTKNSDCS